MASQTRFSAFFTVFSGFGLLIGFLSAEGALARTDCDPGSLHEASAVLSATIEDAAEKFLLPGASGIADKNTETFRYLQEAVLRSLRRDPKGIEGIGGGSLSAADLLKSFEANCGDANFADRVEWHKVTEGPDSQVEAWFVCAPDTEHPETELKSFAFTLKRGSDGLGAVPLAMAAVKKEEDSRAQKLQSALVAAGRSAGTVAASVYLSSKWVEKAMEGQGHDKITHARMSAFLSSAIAAASYYFFDLTPEKAALVGGSIGWGLGAAREVKQGILKRDPKNTNGTWSDIRANNYGVLLGSLMMYVNLKFQ